MSRGRIHDIPVVVVTTDGSLRRNRDPPRLPADARRLDLRGLPVARLIDSMSICLAPYVGLERSRLCG